MNSSYIYVYDDFLSDRSFERAVASLENELSIRGMSGQIGRLALFRSARDLVAGLVNDSVQTIVMVGNDGTLEKTMWFLPELKRVVGYIPLASPSLVGDLLGIPVGNSACDILSARYIENIDMGVLDDRYFLTEVILPETHAGIEIEGRYTVSSRHGGVLSVRNLCGLSGKRMEPSDVQDGLLEAVITPNMNEPSGRFFRRKTAHEPTKMLIREGKIRSGVSVEAFVDHHAVQGKEFCVSVTPSALQVITGRGRMRGAESSLQKMRRSGNLPSARMSLPRGRDTKKK